MNDDDLLRYSRHILLDEIGIDGQQRIARTHALVIGAGGLGSPVALYLGSAGIGRITLVDGDRVELSNLQRQLAHGTAQVGEAKAASAAQAVARINPQVDVVALPERVSGDRLAALVAEADVVVDCSDNFATRHGVNAACVKHRKPLVAGAAIAFDGQLAVYDTRDAASPCYACAFPDNDAFQDVACATMGIFAPLVGIIGSLQAAEALKLMAGIGTPLVGRLLMLDARSMAWTEMRIGRDPGCPVCRDRPVPVQ